MANIQKSRQGSHSFPLCMARYRLRKPLHNLAGQNTSIRAGRRGFGRVLVGGRDHAESTNPQYACLNLLFLVKLKFFGNDMDKASAIKQVCEDQPQQAPSLGSDFSNGPVPPICKTCAPVGADYQWNYTKDGSECVKETVKLSETEWGERTTASSPAECHVNNDTFQYTERESNDPRYYLLYDEGRFLLALLPNIAAGQTGPSAWRLVSNQTWNTARPLTRVK
jgi:hypothetical protein